MRINFPFSRNLFITKVPVFTILPRAHYVALHFRYIYIYMAFVRHFLVFVTIFTMVQCSPYSRYVNCLYFVCALRFQTMHPVSCCHHSSLPVGTNMAMQFRGIVKFGGKQDTKMRFSTEFKRFALGFAF